MDWIIPVGIGVLAVLLLLLICWRRVPADKAMVITGLRKRVLVGRGGFVIPILETSCMISLEAVSMTTDITEAPSKQGIFVDIAGTAVVKVDNQHDAVLTAVEQFCNGNTVQTTQNIKTVVEQILEGKLRGIVSTLTVEQINEDRVAFENSIEDSIKILKGLAPNYEAYHGVKISDGILRQAVLLSERYITDRFLPDKAIDLIDEACSDLNLKDPDISRRMQLQREIDDFEKERAMLEEQGAQEGAEPDYEQIATLKSKILQRQTELNTLLLKGDPQLTMENIAHVIELWTKIPASKIREEEFQRLSQLEERLKSHIVGQDEAIAAVSAAVRRNRRCGPFCPYR